MFYVYSHIKPDGSIFYIGKGKEKRAWDRYNRSVYWKRIAKKYGFEVSIIAKDLDEELAFLCEQEAISINKQRGAILCNHTAGGEGPSGYTHSEAVKAIIGLASSKRKREDITKHKASLSHPKNKKCIVDGVFYHSVGEAARQLKISQPSLSNWLNGKTKPSLKMNITQYGWAL